MHGFKVVECFRLLEEALTLRLDLRPQQSDVWAVEGVMKHIAFAAAAVVVSYLISIVVAERGSDAQYIILAAFSAGLLYIYGILSVSFWARKRARDKPEIDLPGMGRDLSVPDSALSKKVRPES